MFTAALFSLWVATFSPQPEDAKPPPKRPDERFTVYVEATPQLSSTMP
jgi:hypothetical protein